MVKQQGESVVDRLRRDEVIIVENEGKSFRHSGNLVDQRRQERLDWRRLGGPRSRDDRLADALAESRNLDGLDRYASGGITARATTS
jgi:hypothetical protein